jgi:type III pantothenate kinase
MKTSAPEFLLIDCGNTRLKWATARTLGPIRIAGEIATGKVTPTWIATLARKYPAHQLVLASVVPKLIPTFRRAFAKRIEIVSGTSPHLGLTFSYPKPGELGADRIAAAVSAHTNGHFPAIIVACGTATAFTVLDAKGRLCGGAIAPGLQTQLAALLGATAQLPGTNLKSPRTALAKSTQEAIRAGIMLNFLGGVKEIIQCLSDALPGNEPTILLTGGNAGYLAEELEIPFKLRPLLVLEGLRIIGVRARSKTL